jgi:hypothetical protein
MRKLTEREQSLMWQSLRLPDGRQAVLLNYPAKGEERSADEVNRNLLCVDDDERVHWQVNPPPPFQPSGDPFVHIAADGSKLMATRFFGDICEVNTSKGDAVIVGWTK